MEVVLPSVGDIVRLRSGTTAMEVRKVFTDKEMQKARVRPQYDKLSRYGFYITAAYLTNQDDQYNDHRVARCVEDFVPWDGGDLTPTQKRNRQFAGAEQETTTMSKLYSIVGTDRFGTYLATNSTGQLVLEMKGENRVEAFDKDKVEEVRPYTIRCAVVSDAGASRKVNLSFETTKGAVAKGDYILTPQGVILRVTALDTKGDYILTPQGVILRVTALDTKAESNAGVLRGRKLVTELIGGVEDDDGQSQND